VQDGIEIITGGKIILDKVNDQYYYVVIYSGNSDFFSLIDGLKISDLSLPTTAHLWEFNTQAFSNLANLDYCYPLCEPSDDASIAMRPPYTVDRVEIWGGYIWCFVKLSVIIQAILTDAGYTATGDVFTDDKYIKLYMPITDLQLSNLNIKPLLYSLRAQNRKVMTSVINTLDCQQAFVTCPVGDLIFKTTGVYIVSYAGNYTFRVYLQAMRPYIVPTFVYLYNGAAQVAMFTDDGTILPIRAYERAYSTTYVAAAGDHLSIRVSYTGLAYYDIQVIGITNVAIGYGSIVVPENHFGGLTQTDIIKTMCNLYALVPETNSKERNINFWNYSVLFTNIPIARDWSSYLSEKEDEVEFKFGDYARKNYLRYKESDDVIKDTGTGILEIDDDNLPMQKDIVTLPLSTCDEVTLLGDVNVSRIAFNQYDAESDSYIEQKSIDSRLVYINFIQDPYTSPPYEKTFAIRDTELPGGAVSECITPRKASSIEIAFSTLITNYSALQNILYQTNIRKCKFNLPVYEVAGFSHDVPIYVSQYKAYFYVNKILNYIPGKLCEIELIKL
jgi:hypothetical protein